MKILVAAIALFLGVAVVVPAEAAKVSPKSIAGSTTINAAAAKQIFDRGVPFVDVRKNSDWDAGRVPGAVHLELKKVLSADKLAKVAPKDGEVVFYCNGENACVRPRPPPRPSPGVSRKSTISVMAFRPGRRPVTPSNNPVKG